MATNNCVLEVNNLTKNFDNNFNVIKDITFQARRGEFICFIGPSGCGKSVLLYALAGFLESTSGNILMNGKSVSSISSDRIMMFQNNMLFPWKSVLGNVLFGLTNSPLTSIQKNDLACHYLELVDLLEFKDWSVSKLSGGMQQRVAFARSLVTDPEVLLMDEPFSALDSLTRRYLRRNLIDIWQKTKKTIVFVTHSMDEALYLADTIHILSSRPTSIRKTVKVTLPRPRDMSDPKFVSLLHLLESEVESQYNPEVINLDFDINKLFIN